MHMLRALQNEGKRPSIGTLLGWLKTCSKQRDLETGQRLHDLVMHNKEHYSHIHVANTLVDMYANCGRMDCARQVFDGMPRRDVVSWNCLIRGYAQSGMGESALELYDRMQTDCSPNNVTILAALKACAGLAEKESGKLVDGKRIKLSCLARGRCIHEQAVQGGHDQQVFVGSSLVDMYAKCCSMDEARKVFESMQKHDVVSWNAIIMGYAQSGEGQTALQLFSRMKAEGFLASRASLVAVLKACSSLAEKEAPVEVGDELVKVNALEATRDVHREAAKMQVQLDLFIASGLVDTYAKCGSLADARSVFERMPQHSVVSWNCMILGYANNKQGEEAVKLYERMQDMGLDGDAVTTLGALKACACMAGKDEHTTSLCLEKGRVVHRMAVERGHHADIEVASILVDLYAKCGAMVDARRVFDRMPRRDLVPWTAIILGYVQSGEAEIALTMYKRLMTETDLVPDAMTFVAGLKACASLAALEAGKQIHAQIVDAGLEKDIIVGNCILDFYSKCASMEMAKHVFDLLPLKNLVTWNALMVGYSCQGEADQVFDLFQTMQKEKVRPNGITFLALLSVCSHRGLVEKGKSCFDSMASKHGVQPELVHYTCMVDMLGRGNRLDDALTMVREMPFQGDEVLWKTLLGAAQKWRNERVANIAFESLTALGTVKPAAYVLMSNVYVPNEQRSCSP